jgi:tetratricopeptide (TPR) repeat protein
MMRSSDKSNMLRICAALFLLMIVTGCDRMTTSRSAQLVKEAEAKAGEGDYIHAVGLYEAALDGSAQSADVHYQLALLYDDKMNDALHALHHFKRYLILAPNGSHAADAKNFMKRDEMTLMTSLSGDSVITRAEVARLKNENLSLRKEIEERWATNRSAPAATGKPAPREARAEKKSAASVKRSDRHSRTYVVRPGDTLASISQKFYKTPARWKEIREANPKSVDDPEKLKVGESLAIP